MKNVRLLIGEGLWFNKQENRLEKVITNKIFIDLNNMSINYILKYDGREIEVEGENLRIYSSAEDFEKGYLMHSTALGVDVIYSKIYGRACIVEEDKETGEFTIKAWMFDKEPVYKEIPKIKLTMTLVEEKHPNWISSYKFSSNERMDIYTSREDAINMNTYKELNSDGTFTEHVGYGVKLKLSKEQERAVEEFEEAYKKVIDLGVGFVFDRDESLLHAYNGKDVDYVTDDSNDGNECGEKARLMNSYLGKGLDAYVYGFYEGEVYAVFKGGDNNE